MLKIKCSRCKSKILKYQKIGYGQVLRCYLKRIKDNYGLVENDQLKCPRCENIIGIKQKGHFKMKQDEFTYGGKKIRK